MTLWMLSGLLLAALFGVPGIALLAAACGRGAAPWPWPRGVAVGLAVGVAIAGIVAIALGVVGVYSLPAECAVVGGVTIAVLAAARFRPAWPFARASVVESVGFAGVVAIAAVAFLGHPFEMLLGERDATVYTVTGIGLARQGSIVLRDEGAVFAGGDTVSRLSSSPVKYPGFYHDKSRLYLRPQGLPMLPALIAIFYGAFGLAGALGANAFLGILAVACVLAAGTALLGEVAAVLAAGALALDLVEVWAARYPVAEILFQMLLFAGLAAFLKKDRTGRAIAGLLLAASLLTKIEAGLIVAPIGVYAIVSLARRRGLLGRAFLVTFGPTTLTAVAFGGYFASGYIRSAGGRFTSLYYRLIRDYFSWQGAWIVAALVVVTLAVGIALALRATAGRRELSRATGRFLAVAVVVFGIFGYWIRPHITGLLAGQEKTLIWLSWYVGPVVLALGFVGLVHFLWTRVGPESLFVLAIVMTLSAVFLHFTFVNLHQIYMTRRYVPATLPLVFLFFGYAIATIGSMGVGGTRVAASGAALLLAAAALYGIVDRSSHMYGHVEYPGLAQNFTKLAEELKDEEIVFLSDGKVRNLLGATLDLVFGLKTLVVWPDGYQDPTVRRWIDEGVPIAALTVERSLEEVPGAEAFESVERPMWEIKVLQPVKDKFPTAISQVNLRLNRWVAGPNSGPLYEFWRRHGERLRHEICDSGIGLVGGDRYLVRRVRSACPEAGANPPRHGYLAASADATGWQSTLDAYGARYDRRDLDGAVLFDRIVPQSDPEAEPLSTSAWKLRASDGRGNEGLAVDGRLDTRWGSGKPQAAGMSFTVELPGKTDVSWVRIRMGHVAKDRSRALAIETSVDGSSWNRQEVPTVVDGLRWTHGILEENPRGDVDLWVNARGVRFVRIVNLSASSYYDWSIAELEMVGKPSR